MACENTSLAVSRLLNPDCRALGGLSNEAYLGNVADIASVTRNATTKVIEAITMTATKKLYKWVGRQKAFDTTSESPAGVNTWNQGFGMVFDMSSAADSDLFEKLAAARNLFAVVLTNDDTYVIYGLGVDAAGNIRTGLSGLAKDTASKNRTAETTGETGAVIRLTGEIGNVELQYSLPSGTLATNKASLEAKL